MQTVTPTRRSAIALLWAVLVLVVWTIVSGATGSKDNTLTPMELRLGSVGRKPVSLQNVIKDLAALRYPEEPRSRLLAIVQRGEQTELEMLPRIGPKLAKSIIEYGKIDSLDVLLEIDNIGPKTLAAMINAGLPAKSGQGHKH
jgi:hypothetical protein